MHLKLTCQQVLEQDTENQNSCQCSIFGACAHLCAIGYPPNERVWMWIGDCRPVIKRSLKKPVYICRCRHSFIIYYRISCLHLYFNSLLILPPPPYTHSWPVPQLEPSQIRLIVYQDCERRGRNVLFDSSTMKRGPEETPIPVSHAFTLLLHCVHCPSWQMGSNFSSVIYIALIIMITCRGFTGNQTLSRQAGRDSQEEVGHFEGACKGG